MLTTILISVILLIVLFFGSRTLRMYYNYWYYTKQGAVPTFFPFPLIGTNIQWLKSTPNAEGFTRGAMFDTYRRIFGNNIPKVTMEFRIPQGIVTMNDPEYVNELYITKNKYFDKCTRLRQITEKPFGDSILFDYSTEL